MGDDVGSVGGWFEGSDGWLVVVVGFGGVLRNAIEPSRPFVKAI
jgi:hypothetical protein